MNVMARWVLAALVGAGSIVSVAFAGTPDCTGTERWPTAMAFVHLKNAHLVTNNQLDFTKTKTTRLASEKIGNDLYRQVHLVAFTRKDGSKLEAVTINDASNQECSMSGVQIYLVSQSLGGLK